MPVPQIPEKYQARAILTPADMLAYRQKVGMLPRGPGPDAVILCLQRGLPERAKRRHPLNKIGRLNGDLFGFRATRNKVMVLTNFGLGSPLMAGLAEEFIAWGAKQLVSISMAGGIHPELKAGDIVVCNRAVRDEGTSHHYLPPERYVDGNADLASRLVTNLEPRREVRQGATWTTDATFRETDLEVRRFASEGVLTVEMETAALFAVCEARRIPASAVLVTGDSLADGEWNPPQDMRTLDAQFDVVYDAVIEVLAEH